MDIYGWVIFFISNGLMGFGIKLVQLSKGKLKGKTIKEKNKKKCLVFGIILICIGFSIFLYLFFILFIT